MNKGICIAGNMIVDITYPIEAWPKEGELTHIGEGICRSTGGVVCNTISDLARMDPTLHLVASGFAGKDEDGDYMLAEMAKYPNIDLSMVRRNGATSFTAVMSNMENKARTMFQFAGGNRYYGEDDIDFEKLDVDIFHIGYIMLLPNLDSEDKEYGTKMARLLHRVQQMGIKTSVDVVTEAGERFQKLVCPALKYMDYCIINEIEAQKVTGVLLREDDGTLHPENMRQALAALKNAGVSTWAVIHCPEMGAGIDENGEYFEKKSLKLPKGFIQGTVGAGDAFCAGVLYAAQTGKPMPEALRLGAYTAASSLSKPGASDGVGSVEENYENLKQYEQ